MPACANERGAKVIRRRPPRRPGFNKYNAQRTTIDGISFRSKGEASCYALHKLREKAGEIVVLGIEPTVLFESLNIKYKPDGWFSMVDGGQVRYWDHKGFQGGHRWLLIRKIWAAVGPAPLDVYNQVGTQSVFKETILPKNLPN